MVAQKLKNNAIYNSNTTINNKNNDQNQLITSNIRTTPAIT